MKKVLWGLGIVVIGAGLFGLGWFSHGGVGTASDRGYTSPNPSTTKNATVTSGPTQAPPPALVSQNEFQQLRAARESVMQANPELAAEYQQIISDMKAQQAKLDAALIKADPKVAPIVAKLVALRQMNGAQSTTSGQGPK